ncbi:MAG: preprotein translocase subunit SecE [Candidatus Nomurabacteria bacterium]|nr:preprotein translocase subunit SecE [Candidatus Nomurabacteria bacterium]
MAENKTKIKQAKSQMKLDSRLEKRSRKNAKKAEKRALKEKNRAGKKKRHLPKFLRVILSPFFAIGRYVRDSFREIRQVRWPNRKATWKSTFAVLVYVVIFFGLIMLLDTLFTALFNKILG